MGFQKVADDSATAERAARLTALLSELVTLPAWAFRSKANGRNVVVVHRGVFVVRFTGAEITGAWVVRPHDAAVAAKTCLDGFRVENGVAISIRGRRGAWAPAILDEIAAAVAELETGRIAEDATTNEQLDHARDSVSRFLAERHSIESRHGLN